MPRWSLVVPLYQESARIGATVRKLAATPLGGDDVELVFVDDGSTDDTVGVLQAALREHGLRGEVLRLPQNEGKGAAVRRGVLHCSGRVVAFVDADLSSPPEAVLQVLHAVEAGAQVVVASRGHDTSDIVVHQSAGRETAGKTFNRLVRLLGLTTLPDTQCGLKAFDADVVGPLFEPLRVRRFAFDVEVLARARALGLEVRVLPTTWAHVEQSRVKPVRDGARMAWDALRVALLLRRESRARARRRV